MRRKGKCTISRHEKVRWEGDRIVLSFSLGGARCWEKHPALAAATVMVQGQSKGQAWGLAQKSRSLHSGALARSDQGIKALFHIHILERVQRGLKPAFLFVSKHIGLALQGNSAGTAPCKISMFSSEFYLQNVE